MMMLKQKTLSLLSVAFSRDQKLGEIFLVVFPFVTSAVLQTLPHRLGNARFVPCRAFPQCCHDADGTLTKMETTREPNFNSRFSFVF